MFGKTYEDRLQEWAAFRESLEDSEDPFRDLIAFYKQAPSVSIHTDPFNQDAWPTAWELLLENQYCDFCRVLGYYYSLQLTERFKGSTFEIHISTDNALGYMYLLFVDNQVLGYDETKAIDKIDLPKDLRSQHVFPLSGNH